MWISREGTLHFERLLNLRFGGIDGFSWAVCDFAEAAGTVLLISLLCLSGGIALWLAHGHPGNWAFGVLLGAGIGIAGMIRRLLMQRDERLKASDRARAA